MIFSPVEYDYPLFRPPSEALSFILQVSLGCSWNRCSFCEMYKEKSFSIRSDEEIFHDIKKGASLIPETRKIFLADGDAMALPTNRLLGILATIKREFPKVRRISSYALPRNILRKSPSELAELRDAGLKLIYLGIESGDDEILRRIEKGETAESTTKGLLMAKEAGMKSSVIIINGLGGSALSRQHALNSAKLLNDTQPEYASTLVLSFPKGEDRFISSFGEGFIPLTQVELFEEMMTLIESTNLKSTVFRSDHASNYLSLKGILGRDKERLLKQLREAIDHPEGARLREEWQRGL